MRQQLHIRRNEAHLYALQHKCNERLPRRRDATPSRKSPPFEGGRARVKQTNTRPQDSAAPAKSLLQRHSYRKAAMNAAKLASFKADCCAPFLPALRSILHWMHRHECPFEAAKGGRCLAASPLPQLCRMALAPRLLAGRRDFHDLAQPWLLGNVADLTAGKGSVSLAASFAVNSWSFLVGLGVSVAD